MSAYFDNAYACARCAKHLMDTAVFYEQLAVEYPASAAASLTNARRSRSDAWWFLRKAREHRAAGWAYEARNIKQDVAA